jgi:hypothetical protein
MKEGPPPTLCGRCENGQVMRSEFGHEETWCFNSHPARTIRFPVTSCNEYRREGEMTEYDAKQIGWVLEVKAGKVIGFKPPLRKGDD